ncbi:MAG: NlpC/P60 family protein [Sphingobacteriaceae bacterium]|nr:MAG: NlpC/P60 family protein [Sphingobacteriaceae bacterium]
MKQWITVLVISVILSGCDSVTTTMETPVDANDALKADSLRGDTVAVIFKDSSDIDTKNVVPENLVAFAKTLIGVPYKYASADPSQGFDCSGFITYVFNHFNIEVPRSSIDFTNVGTAVDKAMAKPGDLILFTGTDTLETHVGHMGIVTENTDSLRFIHSTSGKKYGVTITPLNEYYLKRFVKVVRVF